LAGNLSKSLKPGGEGFTIQSKGVNVMPFLREAVQKQREHFIRLLVKNGIAEGPDLEKWTLTELVALYDKHFRKS
jgi:Fur-regulated basic protein A